MGKKYGYARCSTNEARQDVERQVRDLEAMGADEVATEYKSGGARKERERFKELWAKLREGDTLCATELSRITRSLHDLCHLYEDALRRRLRLSVGNMSWDFSEGPVGPFPLAMLQMMGVFAELERGMAVERINSGLDNARGKGRRLGRPKKTAADIPPEIRGLWPEYKAGAYSKAGYARLAGVSRPTIAKYVRLMEAGEAKKAEGARRTGGTKEKQPGSSRPRKRKEEPKCTEEPKAVTSCGPCRGSTG